MSLETYLLYLAAVAVFFATPPDTSQLLIISNSIRHGVRRSLWTVFGDLSANAIQMTAAAFGLAAIIATSATAFALIKWLGVAYLAWIGLQLILSKESSMDAKPAKNSAARLYRQGFLTSMANPFAVVFFGALFPQFIDPAAQVLPQLAILGATYLVVDGVILMLWGWLGARSAGALRGARFGLVNKICGTLMLAAAALLALKDMRPAQ
ncbi:Threonine/homoserine/homoserine lactone efflux protein [Roseovarius nanhaiticus]|uniref:Threonine/homoserine/homoserine lactone efflux protein n=1 Tax=Roseovarius nanhaiticus TaxID=573024 RepID=A0A1N7FK83_9RHOB|nr:LysE family translocator [Roseovarius nanhaiticus]SEK52769.1 Threonine/homoserine/homoserine lactone efflux protein [Roseovarius nanhaiticus]SIS00646.1 Threonine/homoserine/homoserine lactone efflux protein [Roseovarius nanhaiticus]